MLYLTGATAGPDGHPDRKIQESLNTAYHDLAKELGGNLVPVGAAREKTAQTLPEVKLFADGDFVHPSPVGSYLNACVFFATLFGSTSVDLPANMAVYGSSWDFKTTLGAERLDQLQKIAWDSYQGSRIK